MRKAGSNVRGRGARSARHHRRKIRNRPCGVAPSPSRLLARMPVRPSTTRIARPPTNRIPCLPPGGRRRTRTSEKTNLCIGLRYMSGARPRWRRGRSPACSFSPQCSTALTSCTPGLQHMSNTRKILIVDDDAELRDALVEQLALHEEFESIAVETGARGVQTAKAGQVDLVVMDV